MKTILRPILTLILLSVPLYGQSFRVATYNASLTRENQGQLLKELQRGKHSQISNVAHIIRETAPDILLINEFDLVDPNRAIAAFQKNYLAPLRYPHVYFAAVNTGVPTNRDLDRDGTVGGAGDAQGFGNFPGQYGMLVLSRYPIHFNAVRTFQQFLWKDMPGNLMPKDWYSDEDQGLLRLSSKSHWDVPIQIGKRVIHLLVSHPTPPVFDGEEDRNGRRNHDEIRFWIDYIGPKDGSAYIYDDAGKRGGLDSLAHFVLCGDLNADPIDGNSTQQPIKKLLTSPRINTKLTPRSQGGHQAAQRQGGANRAHRGDPQFDTGDFDDELPGNLRVDYVLPSNTLNPVQAKIHWPVSDKFHTDSDHRLVFIDIE
jgi:endonuclease/exonuclease/phosphatase family metal-dependent hydrolase